MIRPLLTSAFALSLIGCVPIGSLAPSNQPVSLKSETYNVADNDIIRIVTPFADPRVITTSDAEIQRNQHVLYVLPSGQERIAMFVTASDDETQSINITLNPGPNGVREIDILAEQQKAQPVIQAIATAAPEPVGKQTIQAKKKSPSRKVEPWDPRPCKLCRDPDDNGGGNYNDKAW